MIANRMGTIFKGGDDPFLHTLAREMIQNAYTMRSDLIKHGMDPRRDYNKECGWPDENELTSEDYRKMYERNPVASRVVQVMPLESWSATPEVYEDEDVEKITEFEKAVDELDSALRGEKSWYRGDKKVGSPVWESLRRLDILSGIGSYGIMLLGLDDGLDLAQPVQGFKDAPEAGPLTGPIFAINARQKRKLLYLSVFPEYCVDNIEFEKNRYSPRYNKPKFYHITLTAYEQDRTTTGRDQPTFRVHWSRVLHLADNIEASEIFGVSRQRPVYNNLLNTVKIYGASAEGAWKGSFPGLSLQTHPQLGGDVTIDTDNTRKELWDFFNGLQRALITEGMDVKSLSPMVTDLTGQLNMEIEAICIQLGIPVRIFKGSERGELASGQDDSTWNDRLRSRRHCHITPRIIIPFIDRLIQMGVLPEPKEFMADWPDPEELTPLEKATVTATRVDAMSKYVAGNVSTLMDPLDFLVREMDFSEDEATEILEAAVEHTEEKEEEDLEKQEEQMKLQQKLAPPAAPGRPQTAAPAKPGQIPAGPKKAAQPAPGKPQPSLNQEDLKQNVFCPTGEGGGRDPTCELGAGAGVGVAGSTKLGVHVKKLAGNKEEGEKLLRQLDGIDETHGGKLSAFLENHPIKTINVGAGSKMGASNGLYEPHTGKLSVKPIAKTSEPGWLEPDGAISTIHGNKVDDGLGDGAKRAKQEATFVHEVGHHVALTVIKHSKDNVYKRVLIDNFMEESKHVSKYAADNPHEYFSETFAAYHLDKKSVSPRGRRMVEEMMSLAEKL